MVVPYSVSTSGVTTVKDLDLKEGQYEILKTVSESASVVCEYKNDCIKIKDGEGLFSYTFQYDVKDGWKLKSFSGAAPLGFFTEDLNDNEVMTSIVPEQFARRVAMSRIINSVVDYNADGILEPITVTSVSDAGDRKVEYRSTVRAKLISIKPTK